jgi:hypothetical protein
MESSMIARCLLVASFAISAGCMKTSETYCAKHGAEDPANCPAPDAPSSCTSNTDCTATPATAVCDTGTGRCVECDAASAQTTACDGDTPVCADTDMCRRCTSHTECASEVCLPDGSCGTEDEVAYVAPTGSGSACTKQSPCDRVQKALAVTPPRRVIKLSGTLVEAVVIQDRDITLLGAIGATLANGTNDTTNLEIRGTSTVAVHDLQIGDGNSRTLGVRLDAGPTGSLLLQRVRVTDNVIGAITVLGGELSLQRSTIANNVRGGIVVRTGAGKFDVRNNFIYSNGSGSGTNASLFGGVLIEADVAGKLQFNTVAFNEALGTQNRAGIACYGLTNNADGNLVYANRDGIGSPDTQLQMGGDCPRGTSVPLGSGDLGFRNPSLSTPDFHLTALTPTTVLDAGGMCQASNGVDIDDQTRPNGGSCDVGADELDP